MATKSPIDILKTSIVDLIMYGVYAPIKPELRHIAYKGGGKKNIGTQ